MCRTGCKTKEHNSYAECLRASSPTINGSTTAKFTKDLNDYAYARSVGLSPESSSGFDARKALQEAGA